jgi:starch-binding outer membrane protein, SusD/RagB family
MSLTACDNFLDESTKGSFTSENIYSTSAEAETALNGVYNAATYCINLWKFGDVASDDAVKGGADGDQSDIGYLDDFSADADNGVILAFWENTYETITRANNVISGVSSSTGISSTLKERYINEAKFFRAFSYFQLVNIYGKVPLKLYSQNSSENINVALSSIDSVYAQIDRDLTAATALPSSYSSSDAGRITKGAAFGLLAKSQLYQKKYTASLASIDSLENLGVYSLESNYATLFKEGNADSPEAIFAIRFLSGQNPSLGNSLNQWLAPEIESGYYFDAPTQSYVNCFTEKQTNGEEDPRLDASIGRDGYAWFNDTIFSASWSPSTGYLVKKHNQPLSEVSAAEKADGDLAYIYLRYADILLMKAEDFNESDQPALALAPLNKVRNRAGLANVTNTAESTLRTIIRTERRRELGFEFHRFFDLMRYGESAATEALGSNFTWSDPRFYFPIPQSEIDSNSAISE